MYLDDYNLSANVDFKFTTRSTAGVPTALAGTPAISVYKTNSATQTTTGITLTADFDSVTGLNHVRIDLSSDGTFYAAGCDFQVVITTGTVGGGSVVGEVVATFSILNRSALRPTTAGRTLDVSLGGEAGIDWANIGSPTTTVGLTNTTIGIVTLTTTATTVTNQLTAAAIATGVWQDTTAGDFTVVGSIGKSLFTSGAAPGAAGGLFIAGSNAATTISTFTTTTNNWGNTTYNALTVTNNVIVSGSTTLTGAVTASHNGNDISVNTTMIHSDAQAAINAEAFFDGTGYAAANSTIGTVTNVSNGVTLAASAIQAIWDAATSALTTVGSIGKWILDRLDVVVSTRATPAQVNTECDTAIADASLATAANLATVAGYLDTEIAAILADTNEMQTDWANGGRLDLLIDGIKVWTDRLGTAMEVDGLFYRFTTNALEQAPAGGGGGGGDTIVIQALSTTINDRVTESTITVYYLEDGFAIGPNIVLDANDDPVDLTAYADLQLAFEDQWGTDVLVIDTADITISGVDDNQWTATGTSAITTSPNTKGRWSLRGIGTGINVLLGHGDVVCLDAAAEDVP